MVINVIIHKLEGIVIPYEQNYMALGQSLKIRETDISSEQQKTERGD